MGRTNGWQSSFLGPLLRYVSETEATVWVETSAPLARPASSASWSSPVLAKVTRGLAHLEGAPDPGIRWRALEGPYFDNQAGTLRRDGRTATARLDKTAAGEEDERKLEKTFERRLA